MPEPWSDAYRRRLTHACEQRSDMDMWYSTEPRDAYLGAQLADLVIAAARRPAKLPFVLRCTPFPPDMQGKPRCRDDVRKTVASIDPRAIIEVRSCYEPAASAKCLAVVFAKRPTRDTEIADRWSLDISFSGESAPQIERVEVGDDYLIID